MQRHDSRARRKRVLSLIYDVSQIDRAFAVYDKERRGSTRPFIVAVGYDRVRFSLSARKKQRSDFASFSDAPSRREENRESERKESHVLIITKPRTGGFVTCISSGERRNASCTLRADDLGVPPLPRLAHPRYLRPLCLGVGRYFGVNLAAGLTTAGEAMWFSLGYLEAYVATTKGHSFVK